MSDEHRLALPAGSQIHQFKIESVLGYGGFGIVYKARHMHLEQEFAIKEYLPQEIATREGPTVYPLSNKECEDFEEGMRRFLAEAKQLVQFRDAPSVVSCTDFFEANGTAYLIMAFEDGMDLSALLAERQRRGIALREQQLLDIILPLLDGLEMIHDAGVLHRDIKPGNILIRRSDELPVLIDFGAAKQNFSQHSKSMAPYSPGYAAFEQSSEEGALGPWTDIYAVGALMWRMISDATPPKAENRVHARLRGTEDPMVPASTLGEGRYSASVLSAIDKCIAISERDRFQSVKELKNALSSIAEKKPEQSSSIPQAVSQGKIVEAPKTKKPRLIIALSALIVLCLGLGGLIATGTVGVDGSLFNNEELNKLRNQFSGLKVEIEQSRAQLLDQGMKQLPEDLDQRLSQLEIIEWNDLVDIAIFDTPAWESTEKDYKKALALAEDSDYQNSINMLLKVRDTYTHFLKEFKAAEGTVLAHEDAENAKRKWINFKNNYKLTDPPEVERAETATELALTARENGQVEISGEQWRNAADLWRDAIKVTADEVARIEKQQQQRTKELVGTMISIPSGSFNMGSENRDSNNFPQRTVNISAFQVGKYEITRGEFRKFADSADYHEIIYRMQKDGCWGNNKGSGESEDFKYTSSMHWANAQFGDLAQNDSHPVTCVSRGNAQAYINWLNEETGQLFRLLSEAEYEYLLNAGQSSKFPFGDELSNICAYGNYADLTLLPNGQRWPLGARCSDNFAFTAPVGQYKPNKFGVHDLTGNVAEWVGDCWRDNYLGAPADGGEQRLGDCNFGVLRGGAWNGMDPTVTGRGKLDPDAALSSVGFRIAKDI